MNNYSEINMGYSIVDTFDNIDEDNIAFEDILDYDNEEDSYCCDWEED